MQQRDSFAISAIVHALFLAGMLVYVRHTDKAVIRHHQIIAAKNHSLTSVRNQARAASEDILRLRKVAEKMTPSIAATETYNAATAGASEILPHSAGMKLNDAALSQIVSRATDDYRKLRDIVLENEARDLSSATGQTLDAARKAVERDQPLLPNASGGTQAELLEAIAAMRADAQRFLGESIRNRNRTSAYPAATFDGPGYQALARSSRWNPELRRVYKIADRSSSNVALDDTFYGVVSHAITPPDLAATLGNLTSDLNRNVGSISYVRRVTNGTSGKWVAPSSWYIIGPYENVARINVDTVFPPEFELDRDATYIGKRGEPISWVFAPSAELGVIPPHMEQYSIYYAFTEIYFETKCDCWVAIGSDDHSMMWLNDIVVWNDGKELKSWTPTQGFRKVHFEKGINRILFRLENGINEAMFSVAILLPAIDED